MIQYAAKDLYLNQTDLVDSKVENAVNSKIEQVEKTVNSKIEKVVTMISALKDEVHDLRHEMNTRFNHIENRLTIVETKLETKSEVDTRLTAVETKLGMRNELLNEVRSKAVEYGFKAGWLLLATVVSIVLLYFHIHP